MNKNCASDAERLQQAIDTALVARPIEGVQAIKLDGASDETELTLEAGVLVHQADGIRPFTIATVQWLQIALSRKREDLASWENPDNFDIYTAGVPMIAVRVISGDTIVRAIGRYLEY